MVPLIVTMDLEVAYDHDINQQRTILEKLCYDFKLLNLPTSIFTTSESADLFSDNILMLKSNNNEICCHGYNHRTEENYKIMSELMISENIRSATSNIENIIQDKVVCFRGPGMSTSVNTQNVLINNGYVSDFSVCSGRLDFFNSIGGDMQWLISPRFPYHPSRKSPYKKGDMPLWVVPLSSIGFPFISGILYLFGLNFMKMLFQLLLKESLKTNKPIVYMFHSYEFCQYTGSNNCDNENIKFDREGRKFIHKLYEQDHLKRYLINLKFLEYMSSYKIVRPFTGKEYSDYLNGIIK